MSVLGCVWLRRFTINHTEYWCIWCMGSILWKLWSFFRLIIQFVALVTRNVIEKSMTQLLLCNFALHRIVEPQSNQPHPDNLPVFMAQFQSHWCEVYNSHMRDEKYSKIGFDLFNDLTVYFLWITCVALWRMAPQFTCIISVWFHI